MWREYFYLTKSTGKVVIPRLGEFNFSSNQLSIFKLKHIIDLGFDFIKLTEKGEQFFNDNPTTIPRDYCGCA